ncbi:MAG: hypothetical protein IJ266_01235 [Elusimicrobiaceae bacterium]|nr:hypothetical protein [Elusimicrobiaceae bacterium]
MLWQFAMVLGGASLLAVCLWLAGKYGRKAAQLEALKAEIKKQQEEQVRAQKIRDSVFAMDDLSVRGRLHQIANKPR